MREQVLSKMLRLSDGTYLIAPIPSFRVAIVLSALNALIARNALSALIAALMGLLAVLAWHLVRVMQTTRKVKTWDKS